MTDKHVQFSDASQTAVIAAFCGPQDADVYPNQSTISDTDPRYMAFANPALTPEGLASACTIAIQAALDLHAQSWGYDSIVSAASYAASTNVQFAAEAHALIAWRDAAWMWAGAQFAAIKAGSTPAPTSAAAFAASIPAAPARPTS